MLALAVAFVANVVLKLTTTPPSEMGDRLAVLTINLKDVTLEEINAGEKQTKYPGNSVTLTVQDEEIEYSNVEVKGRGNSTWGTGKNPYQIKFADKVDLFGMGESKKWVLLANYFDASYLRNDTAFYLERMLDERYALNGEFVWLVVDGEEIGLYYLTPKVEIGKNRVNLRDEFGVLVELENLHKEGENCYVTVEENCLTVKELVDDDQEDVAMQDFVENFNQLELAARTGDYAMVQSVADTGDLARYYLLSEFTVNPDAYASSCYFYKDGVDDIIHTGPGWDFDYALGNRAWEWAYNKDFYSPSITRVQEAYAWGGEFYDEDSGEMVEKEPNTNIMRLFYLLMQIPEFEEEVKTMYREKMSGKKDETINYILGQADLIREKAFKDNLKWKKVDFNIEVATFVDWVTARFEHFEKTYGESFYAIMG